MINPNDVSPISDINEPDKVRVVLYYNGRLVHVPLEKLLKEVQAEIDDLDTRVTALEP